MKSGAARSPRTRRRRTRKIARPISWRPRNPVTIEVTFRCPHGIDWNKDYEIRRILGERSLGSGFLIAAGVRDHSAEVAKSELRGMVRKLKKIPGVKVRKLVSKWVVL